MRAVGQRVTDSAAAAWAIVEPSYVHDIWLQLPLLDRGGSGLVYSFGPPVAICATKVGSGL